MQNFKPFTEDGSQTITIRAGGARNLIVQGDCGGGAFTFFVSYMGISQIPVSVASVILSLNVPSLREIPYIAGGIELTATLTGSTNPLAYVGVGS